MDLNFLRVFIPMIYMGINYETIFIFHAKSFEIAGRNFYGRLPVFGPIITESFTGLRGLEVTVDFSV